MDANKDVGRKKIAQRLKSHVSNSMEETPDSQIRMSRTSNEKEFQSVRVSSERKSGEVLKYSVYDLKNQHRKVKEEYLSTEQEIRILKQSISHAKRMKEEAEKQESEAMEKASEYSMAESILKNKIEEVNEEHVLVQLATIEAWKESHEAEAEREANAALFSSKIAKTRKKITELIQEVNFSKDLETSLHIINSEIKVLQDDLKSFKAKEENERGALSRKHITMTEAIAGIQEEDLAASAKLASSITELNQAKKELHGLREEVFHVMASMDIIRNECRQTSAEMGRSKSIVKQSESKSEILKSKLIKAKKELELATKAEDNAKTILFHLSATLEQLKSKTDAAIGERMAAEDELMELRSEMKANRIVRNESHQRLQSALQELEETKATEMISVQNLSILSEVTTMARAASSQLRPYLTISQSEFDYLKSLAEGSDEILNKKLTAAEASVNAIKSADTEVIMKTEAIQKEIEKIKKAQEKELDDITKSLAEKKVLEDEANKLKIPELEKQQIKESIPIKDLKVSRNTGSVRRYGRTGSMRGSRAPLTVSPACTNYSRASSFRVRKNKIVIPILSRIFHGRSRIRSVRAPRAYMMTPSPAHSNFSRSSSFIMKKSTSIPILCTFFNAKKLLKGRYFQQ